MMSTLNSFIGRREAVEEEVRIVDRAMRSPRVVVALAIVMVIAAGLGLPWTKVDTDPENMLQADQPERVFHNLIKDEFALHDMLVVGVVNEKDPDGVFNPVTLSHLHSLTEKTARIEGVIRQDLLSLATVDNLSQGGPGVVRFEWMMGDPPGSREDAREIRDAARRIPTIMGTLVSEDEQALAVYVPITDKNESHRIASEIEEIVAGFRGDEAYYITGLPVAEDTFGMEMFHQMGIAAPLAMLIIFGLMLLFFRNFYLVLSPMLVAMATVITIMGVLVWSGFTVHIMSSMIPIFLMPIAVVDSVHILSEFADRFPRIGSRRETLRRVMRELFRPMLYTSLTSAVGFASLMLAPIPPVRVFGAFVALVHLTSNHSNNYFNYDPNGTPDARARSIREWRLWYQSRYGEDR